MKFRVHPDYLQNEIDALSPTLGQIKELKNLTKQALSQAEGMERKLLLENLERISNLEYGLKTLIDALSSLSEDMLKYHSRASKTMNELQKHLSKLFNG